MTTKHTFRTVLGGAALLSVAALGAGCNNWLDPSELTVAAGRPIGSRDPLTVKVLDRLDPALEEERIEFAASNLPTQEDTRAPLGDYGISRNDVLEISISDLQGPGIETIKRTRVSETGNVSLPYIGQRRAEGLTEIELEREIVEAYRGARLIENANVSVQVFEARGRAYTVTGAVERPNIYAIPEADYRVLDAITAAGGVSTTFTLAAGTKNVYIIRRLDERPRPPAPPDAAQPAPRGGAGTGPGTGPGTAPGTTEPATPGDDLAPRPRSQARPHNANEAFAAAIQAQAMQPQDRKVVPLMAQANAGAQQPADDERIINLDGQEVPARRQQPDAGAAPAGRQPARGAAQPPAGAARTGTQQGRTGSTSTQGAAGARTQGQSQGGRFEFNDLAPPPEVRIIRVPLEDLRKGDLRYNVVIRPRDTLVVPYPEVGTYYMGGHVARPGAYSLAGQRVSLMDAIIAASMLDQLAIPDRTDLVRRVAPDRQVFVRVNLSKIFDGTAPDIYLRPEDKILVGTNAIAPFMAVLRNAFRFTYGAGFLYDRNFAYDTNTFAAR